MKRKARQNSAVGMLAWSPGTFTHTGDTINTVVVPLMIFMGTHSRRKPRSQQRRNARAAERKGKGKGKGNGKGKGKGKGKAGRVDPRHA